MITCLGVAVSLSCFSLGHVMIYIVGYNILNTSRYNYYRLVTEDSKGQSSNKYCGFAITLHFYLNGCKLYTAAI